MGMARAGAVVAMSLTVLSCRSVQTSERSTSDIAPSSLEQEILARTRAFSAAVLNASASGWSRDKVAALVDFYDEATIVFPPKGAPLRGREAVRAHWTRPADRRIVSHEAIAERVDVSERLATEYGKLRITFKYGDAPPANDSATYVSYWTRGSDGRWRKQLDNWW